MATTKTRSKSKSKSKISKTTLARKYDDGKPRFDLIPARPLWEVAEVLTISGYGKYTPRDWEKGIRWRKVFSSVMRHMWKWHSGQDLDPDTGKSHLAHAIAQILFLLEFSYTRKDLDDRIEDMEEHTYEKKRNTRRTKRKSKTKG